MRSYCEICGTGNHWVDQSGDVTSLMLPIRIHSDNNRIIIRHGVSDTRLGRAPCTQSVRKRQHSRSRVHCKLCCPVITAIVYQNDVAIILCYGPNHMANGASLV